MKTLFKFSYTGYYDESPTEVMVVGNRNNKLIISEYEGRLSTYILDEPLEGYIGKAKVYTLINNYCKKHGWGGEPKANFTDDIIQWYDLQKTTDSMKYYTDHADDEESEEMRKEMRKERPKVRALITKINNLLEELGIPDDIQF